MISILNIALESPRETEDEESRDELVRESTLNVREGYVSAIAFSDKRQEVAFITHHAKRKVLRLDRENPQELGVKDIVSKVRARTWQDQPTAKTLSFGKGRIMQFIGLMPDGENIVVGGHEVVSRAYNSGEYSALNPVIRLLNKQSRQVADLSWMTVLEADKPKDSAGSPASSEKLTALVVAPNGKQILSGIRRPAQLGLIRWDLELNELLEKSCHQIEYHPVLHRPATIIPGSEIIGREAQGSCQRLSQSEESKNTEG